MTKQRHSEHRLRVKTHMVFLIIFTTLMLWVIPSPAISKSEGIAQEEVTHLIRQAARDTDEAWEEFHAAAIEGTLASPLIQVTIEGQLHEARRLLMKSRIANRDQNYQAAINITQRIKEITTHIIQASRKRKP